ncbi:unnamed protein product [Trichobilharzia szidati]|nr:unnamed protein product [Trichobilharzia szidati]
MHAVESVVASPRYVRNGNHEMEQYYGSSCRRNKYPSIPKYRDSYYTDRVSFISCSPRQRNSRDLSLSNLTGAGWRNNHVYEEPSVLPNPRSFLNPDICASYNFPHRGSSQNLGGYSSSGRLRILNQAPKNYLSPSILSLNNGSCNRSLRDLYKSPERQIIANRYSHLTTKSPKSGPNNDFKTSSNSNGFDREQDIQRRHIFGTALNRDCRIEYKVASPEHSEVNHYTISPDLVNGGSLKVEKRRDFNPNNYNSLDHEASGIIHVKPHRLRRTNDIEPNGKIHSDSVHKRLSKVLQPQNEISHDGSCCMSGNLAVTLYGSKLTEYERKEIQDYPEVYFLGLSAAKRYPHTNSINDLSYRRGNMVSSNNVNGFDDAQSSYILVSNDHLAYRYEVLKPLGKGSFGHVVHAIDHCTKQQVAVKIVKSEARFTRQAVEEIRILKALNAQQNDGEYNVVHLLDHFMFRGHVCMVFELLYINLYELIYRNNFRGFSQSLVRKLTYGILCCLELLYRNKVIHCDLKPENILLRRAGKSKIKVIDFGSSCYINECPYNYIQSRFYRAPEVILGLPYGTPIDMWSLGCILAEFITGEPLFPGEDASDQLACIMEILGLPPMQMIKKGSQSHHYFNSSGQPLYMIEQHQHIYGGNEQTDKLQEAITNLSKSLNSSSKLKRSNGNKHHKIRKSPGSTNLIEALTNSKNSSVCLPVGETSNFGHKIPQPLDPDMIDFLKGCLKWNPDERMNPVEALQHPWIRKMPSFTASSIGRTNSFATSRNAYNNSDSCYTINKSKFNSFSNSPSKTNSDTDFVANILGVRTRKPRQNPLRISRKSEVPSIMSDNSSKPVHSYRRYSFDQNNSKLSDLFDRSVKCTSNPKSPDRLKHPSLDGSCNTKQYRSFLNNGHNGNTVINDNDDEDTTDNSVSPRSDIHSHHRRNRHHHRPSNNNNNNNNTHQETEDSNVDSNNSLIEDEDIINNCNTPSMNDRMKINDDSDCSDISVSDVEQNCRNSGYYDNANSHNGSAKIILFNEDKVIRVPHITTGEHDI